VCGVAAAAAAVASVTLRWRRADRVRRQQLKWFLAVLPLMALSFIATLIASGPWSLGVGLISGTLTPVAIGIAVLRYRLYEIDILLSRAKTAKLTVHGSERLSPHGLRAGFVTEAYLAGARDEQVMDHTRHRDLKTMRGYVRRAKLVTDSATKLLDL